MLHIVLQLIYTTAFHSFTHSLSNSLVRSLILSLSVALWLSLHPKLSRLLPTTLVLFRSSKDFPYSLSLSLVHFLVSSVLSSSSFDFHSFSSSNFPYLSHFLTHFTLIIFFAPIALVACSLSSLFPHLPSFLCSSLFFFSLLSLSSLSSLFSSPFSLLSPLPISRSPTVYRPFVRHATNKFRTNTHTQKAQHSQTLNQIANTRFVFACTEQHTHIRNYLCLAPTNVRPYI